MSSAGRNRRPRRVGGRQMRRRSPPLFEQVAPDNLAGAMPRTRSQGRRRPGGPPHGMRRSRRKISLYPRQDLLQRRKELLPPALGALVGLLLIRPEAPLLHAQVGPRARRGESPSDDTLETIGRPRIRQRFVRLDCLDLTVDSAPVCAKIETVAHDRLEVVLHEPFLDQVWLRERAPDLFRRKRYLPFDNDGERFGRSIAHWSILLSRSSSWSNRLCQKPAIWLVQSISGAKAPSCAL